MISLGIRKVVDTSGWDQSFVDGPGTTLTGISLKRSSSGDSVTSSSTAGSAARRPKWNRKEIEEQEPTKWQGTEVSTYDKSNSGGRVPLESFPAERRSRHVNPFLDNGLSKECQPKECLSSCPLTEQRPGIAWKFRTRGNETHHDEHELDISLRDIDDRGRGTLPVGAVTTWLDSLELFDTSRLRLNRSTSSSPPSVCDRDFVALPDQVSKVNRGTAAFGGQPATFEGRTPVFEGLPPVFEDRSPVFEDRSPVFEGRPPVFEDRSPVFEGRTPVFEGRPPVFEDRSPVFEGRTPASEGRPAVLELWSLAFKGGAPVLKERSPVFEGQSPSLNRKAPATPVQSGTPAVDGGHSDPAGDAPVAYSRAVNFLPAWDLERLEIVYRRLDACGFYFSRMTMDEARLRLTGYPVGTFLLRNSSDPRFLFSLSIQTRRGTTSIRVLYEGGLFRLDSDPDQSYLMPTFDCVLNLVCHYVRLSAGRRLVSVDSPPANSYVLRESTGRRDTPVLLRRPLETTPASLAHSCRKRIHRSLGYQPKNVTRLHLKPSLKSYLSLYPYDI